MEGNMNRELNKRIASTMLTLKRLDIYWRHSNCPVRTKLITADAVIRAKVLYGLDSAQLNEPHLKRLDFFQLKIFRKILKLKTTYIDRSNTNQKTQQQINEEIQKDKPNKTITTFRDAYFKSKRNRLAKIITHKGEDINNITFRDPETLETWQIENRKPGRPTYKWTTQALMEMWEYIKRKDPIYKYTQFDLNNTQIQTKITQTAEEIITENNKKK